MATSRIPEPSALDRARILLMMRLGWVVALAFTVAACGSSPTSPTVPSTPASPSAPPPPVTSASMIDIQACPSQILGFAVDLPFYRQIGCNSFDGPLQPVRRWVRAPKLYIRTVDEAGAPIDSVTLETVQTAMTSIASSLTGGKFGLASVERGTETREGSSGYVTVKWAASPQSFCGDSDAAKDGGTIDFSPKTTGCSCNGSMIKPRTAKHELGHALGYWHTDSSDDLMSNLAQTKPCDQPLSAREQTAAAYHYRTLGS